MRPNGGKCSGCRWPYRTSPRCCCRQVFDCFHENLSLVMFSPPCCKTGKAACVAALLDNGAAHHVQTSFNPTAVTPMLLAAAFDHEDCVILLASHNPSGAHCLPVQLLASSDLTLLSPLSCTCVRFQRSVSADDGRRPCISACSRCVAESRGSACCCRCIWTKV
jgi:hypothetical protein